jgi:hypothetical protein
MNTPPPALLIVAQFVVAAPAPGEPAVRWPPRLPGGTASVVLDGPELLRPRAALRDGVKVARTPPRVEFHYYDCQTYEGKPWSVWGDGLVVDGIYYSSLGDHRSPEGNAFVYRYDPAAGRLEKLADLRQILDRPDGWYTPGKIHSRLDIGRDGWLYFSTHRGSTRVAQDPANHFDGDWILRVHPESGEAGVVVHAPLEMQCLPTGTLDAARMIWYAGTADGLNERPPQFLAYDVARRRTVHAGGRGPYRAMILARSTGRLYFHGGARQDGGDRAAAAQLHRFDPRSPGPPTRIDAVVGLRAASAETAGGLVYTINRDKLWAFDVNSETAEHIGPAAVAGSDYTTSLDVGPGGRYLYYVPGAHGGAERDGTPVVQFDTRTRSRKVICFLHPALRERTGYIPIGSFGYALSADGARLFVTWNGAHGAVDPDRRVPFRSVAMTVIDIPATERPK